VVVINIGAAEDVSWVVKYLPVCLEHSSPVLKASLLVCLEVRKSKPCGSELHCQKLERRMVDLGDAKNCKVLDGQISKALSC
jgi:hypothetical protein